MFCFTEWECILHLIHLFMHHIYLCTSVYYTYMYMYNIYNIYYFSAITSYHLWSWFICLVNQVTLYSKYRFSFFLRSTFCGRLIIFVCLYIYFFVFDMVLFEAYHHIWLCWPLDYLSIYFHYVHQSIKLFD